MGGVGRIHCDPFNALKRLELARRTAAPPGTAIANERAVRLRIIIGALLLIGIITAAPASARMILPVKRTVARPTTMSAVIRTAGKHRRSARSPRAPDPRALRRAKASAWRRYLALQKHHRIHGAAAATGGQILLNGSGFDQGAAGGWSPPDSTGSIGPTAYLEMVNQAIGVYDRNNLGLVSSTNSTAFEKFQNDSGSDPQIQWDPQANRWLYSSIGDHSLALGWSKTSDPGNLTQDWCTFSLNTGDPLEDYPKLGHDASRITITANEFDSSGFTTAHIWTYAAPPPGNVQCTPPAVSTFGSKASPLKTTDRAGAFAIEPANTTDQDPNGYLIAANSSTNTGLMVWHLGGTAGAPVLYGDGEVSVPAYSTPPDAPQPGTTNTLDTAFLQLTQAVAHPDPEAGGAEAIWTQHTVAGASGRSVVHWYEVLPGNLSLRQSGELSDPSSFAFNGAISPTRIGDEAILNFNISGTSQQPAILVASRQAGAPPGTTVSSGQAGLSPSVDTGANCAPDPCRWGDYAGASPDPNNTGVVWGSNQLTSSAGWLTRNFSATPGSTVHHLEADLFNGDDTQSVYVNGFKVGSTGYGQTAHFDLGYLADSDRITFETYNDTGAYTWGYDLTRDGQPMARDVQGQVGTNGANGGDTTNTGQVIHRLTVTAAGGIVSRYTADRAPVPQINIDHTFVVQGDPVQVDGGSSTDPDGTIARYAWDFGDGTSATGPVVGHIYDSAGVYTISLTVTDDGGRSVTTQATVSVWTRPSAPAASYQSGLYKGTTTQRSPINRRRVPLKFRISYGQIHYVRTTTVDRCPNHTSWQILQNAFGSASLGADGGFTLRAGSASEPAVMRGRARGSSAAGTITDRTRLAHVGVCKANTRWTAHRVGP
jgi:chitodextrinase